MDESDLSVLRKRAEGGDKDAVDQLIELAGAQGNHQGAGTRAVARLTCLQLT